MSRSLTPRKYRNTFSSPPTSKPAAMAPGIDPEAPDDGDDQPLDGERHRDQGREHSDRGRGHRPRDAAEQAREHEGGGVGPVDVDTAELGRHVLLRHRSRRQAQPAPVEHVEQADGAGDAHREHEQQVAAYPVGTQLEHHVLEHGGEGEGRAVGGVHDDLVDEEQRPDRGHQGGEVVVDRDEPEAGHVHDEADEPGGERRDQEDQQGRRADEGERGQTHVRSGQGRRGVGHVELAHGAEDQREADPDQRIGRAEQQAVADDLGNLYELEPEITHGLMSLAPRRPGCQPTSPNGSARDRANQPGH